MSPSPERLGAICLALTLTLAPSAAAAQACCGANSTTDFGVVPPHAAATVAGTLAYRQGFGSFDASGVFDGDARFRERDVVLWLGGGVRLWPDSLQLHGAIPLLLQHRALEDESATELGLGDAAAVLRFTALEPTVDGIDFDEPESLVPLWDLYLGVKAPTGTAPGEGRDPTQADVFGNGSWELTPGTKITKSLSVRHLLALRVQYDVRLSTERDQGAATVDFKPGNQLGLRLEWLYMPTMFWSAGAFADLRLAGASSQDGVDVPDSEERLFAMGGQVTYAFAFPDWDVTFGLNSDSFWNQGGMNVPFAAFGLSVGIRRTFLPDDEVASVHEHHQHHHH